MVARRSLSEPELDQLFRALADATRRDIVARLLAGDPASVTTLAARYDMSFAAVQKHVAVLEEAGLVSKQSRGRERIVRSNPERLAQARAVAEARTALGFPLQPAGPHPLRRRPFPGVAMPITDVFSDAQSLTLTVIADYPVPVARLWDAYADPRQLERFWGPETWPATFTRHDMAVGGCSHYHMTGPDGTVSRGWFRFLAVEPLARIEVEDGFADEHGAPNAQMPTLRMTFAFESTATGSRFTSVTRFPSVEAMERLVQMGMMEGMRSAMGQIDALLADLASFAAGRATDAQLLGDTQVRVSRVVRGAAEEVWRAHQEPALMQRWLLGPDGWTMPVCEVASSVGERYRYEWESTDGQQRFGFEGELLESAPPYRSVTSERMIGTDGPAVRNEMTLVPVQGGTLLSIVMTYPSKELRDMILGTGMTGGMEASYARLEREVLAA